MAEQITFTDGAAYERFMGRWSQLVGDSFLDWLAPKPGLRWLDVGCGNGAFTQLIVDRTKPASVDGIDPSEGQLAFARTRPASRVAKFRQGDAMSLPYPDDSFDVAVMPLVIFFVPDPAKGVAEMARVVRPGGLATAYGWDLEGGFPYEVLLDEMEALGVSVPEPPSPTASRLDEMQSLWSGAGLQDIEERTITVHRSFPSFDDYWDTIIGSPSAGKKIEALPAAQAEKLQATLRKRLPADVDGRISYSARANAIKGRR